MSEAAPVILTSLLPLILFPTLNISGVGGGPSLCEGSHLAVFWWFSAGFRCRTVRFAQRMAMGVLRMVGTELTAWSSVLC